MSPVEQRHAALAVLEKTGIWPSNFAPPALHMLWALGLNIRPPHFASFGANALVTGTGFGALWGVAMWFMTWSRIGMPVSTAIGAAALAGLLFGLCMASYYRYGQRRHQLPRWEDLAGARS